MSTTSGAVPPLTVRTFLLDRSDEDEATAALSRAISERGLAGTALGGVRHLSASVVRAVDHEVGNVAAGLLTMDLGDALVAGWRKYRALTDSARRTQDSPDLEEVLALASHRVTCAYSPSVDLLVDDIRVNTFDIGLTLTFDITGVAAVVAGGNLVALQGGACLVTGAMSLEGVVLTQGRRSFDPRLIVRLHRPIRLLPPSVPVPPRQRAH